MKRYNKLPETSGQSDTARKMAVPSEKSESIPCDKIQQHQEDQLPFRRLAEANLFGVGFGDTKGNVTYVNEKMLEMMGHSRSDYEQGRINWARCIAPEYRDELPKWSKELMEKGVLETYEREFLRPDGSRTPYMGAAALEELAAQFARENRIVCAFHGGAESVRLEKKVQLILYRSVRELLQNVKKHAQAQNVTITTSLGDSGMEISLVDDGRGFEVTHLETKMETGQSYGLFSVRQRIRNIGGHFWIKSKRYEGTQVSLKVPTF